MWFDYATSAKMDPAVLPEFVKLKKFTQSWQNSCMFVGLWELKVWCLMINVMQLYSWCQEMFQFRQSVFKISFWTFVLSKQNMESIDQWNQAAISLSEILVAKGNKWASLHYQFINGLEISLSPEVEEHVEKKWQQQCLFSCLKCAEALKNVCNSLMSWFHLFCIW